MLVYQRVLYNWDSAGLIWIAWYAWAQHWPAPRQFLCWRVRKLVRERSTRTEKNVPRHSLKSWGNRTRLPIHPIPKVSVMSGKKQRKKKMACFDPTVSDNDHGLFHKESRAPKRQRKPMVGTCLNLHGNALNSCWLATSGYSSSNKLL